MDHFDYKDGELHCEAVPLSDIAREAGTPVYVYSTATIRHQRPWSPRGISCRPSNGEIGLISNPAPVSVAFM